MISIHTGCSLFFFLVRTYRDISENRTDLPSNAYQRVIHDLGALRT